MNLLYTPLTQSQKLLWLGQELNPKSTMYNMAMSYELQSAVSVSKFTKAFDTLVSQSDALRSIIVMQDGKPAQCYLSEIEKSVEFIDLSHTAVPINAYKDWEKQRVKFLFNLEKCLFDCALIKLHEERYVWYINQHHLITDGWSTTILFSKMSELYGVVAKRETSYLDDLPSFRDYSLHCNESAVSSKTDETTKFWEQKLEEEIPSIAPLYYKEGATLSTESERLSFSLGAERSNKLKELANQKGIRGWTLDSTQYSIFLTVLFAYLYRITGQKTLVIGSPSHNRTSKTYKKTIGLFIESFPLVVNIQEEDTFLSLFKKVQLESNSFLKNAKTGTSSAALSRSYNTFFNYINASNKVFNNLAVKTAWVHPGEMDPRHHLRLHVHDFDNTGEVHLYMDLNTKIFTPEERELVPLHFTNQLDFCLDHPEEPLSSASIITPVEVATLERWNHTDVRYQEHEHLLTKFVKQVRQTPDATALIYSNKRLSYKELDEQSNQVAHYLIKKGIDQNSIVTLSLERSFELIIYMYGVLKAGASYLPVDTSMPLERLRYILKDTHSPILFFNHKGINPSEHTHTECCEISSIDKSIKGYTSSPPEITIAPLQLAYVIYTSGSTGEPKGVLCHHKGICNRLNWMDSDHPLSSQDVLLQKTPITFDVSVWELFWPLQKGATLVIESPEGHKNPEGLRDTIIENRVNIIHFVPSMLSIFAQTQGIANCLSLTKIFCSGEALPNPTVQSIYNQLDVNIYNLYGPTEASVDVTSWLCKRDNNTVNIPIGYPVPNTKLYILDKYLNQTPIGIPGELHIGGVQVARGYLGKEKLTQERFINDILSKNKSDRLYKTGDLARYRKDGAIEYLGRLDHQIKLRGQRIELGEIENTLARLPAVSKAVVSLDQQNNLIAHYTGKQTDPAEITAFLNTQLPSYMIPSGFCRVEQFDYLSSGKIDRKKILKNHQVKNYVYTTKKVAPQTEIEEVIHSAWTEVMEIENIGIHENFIRIGGHSLMAISITSRLKESLELEVAIGDVFNYPTIQAYALYVEKKIVQLLNEEM